MNNSLVRVLLVEDSHEYARVLKQILCAHTEPKFQVAHATRVSTAQRFLSEKKFDAVLLDLSLPDSDGLDTFSQVYLSASSTPIVILTGLDDETLASRAVRAGAQDYLIKGELDSAHLVRSIRYAIERNRVMNHLQRLSMVDDLTGLLNRRGFMEVADLQLKLAHNTGRTLVLFYADLDELKKINDTYGHLEGDRALQSTANLLKSTFRSSDAIGRLGGDEFVILAVDANNQAQWMIARLQKNIEQFNRESPCTPLSLSVGYARLEAGRKTTLETLMQQADQALYQEKRRRRKR